MICENIHEKFQLFSIFVFLFYLFFQFAIVEWPKIIFKIIFFKKNKPLLNQSSIAVWVEQCSVMQFGINERKALDLPFFL